ncbi:MAG: hypothetical protein WEF50_13465 [Myxococcota bacterium]
MQKLRLAALTIAVVGLAAAGANAQTVVSANVTTNTTWGGAANPSPIILQNPIFVKSGATLTILPGTIVRGQPRSGPVVEGSTVGTPGALIVTQTGRIVANGSAAAPIVMTTAAVDNDDDGVADLVGGFEKEWVPGDLFLDDTPTTAPLAPLNKDGFSNVALWGGLVVLGNAPTNNADKAGVGYGKTLVEGLTVPGFLDEDASYGGVEPHDNSGSLRFISIRHAGDELGLGNELNGLSLGGVGDGTTVENIEVYCNFDDGVEWFGGTVNGKNLFVAYVGDDVFDLDEGYTGTNQFLFGIMPFFNENGGTPYGSVSGDKAGEFDGDNYRPDNTDLNNNVNIRRGIDALPASEPTPWPLSNPAMFNMTLIGSTPDAPQFFTPASVASVNRGIQARNGFAGLVSNSVVINTGTEEGFEVGPSAVETPGFDVVTNTTNGLIAFACTTFDNTGTLDATELLASTNGNTLQASWGGAANSANTINVAAYPGLTNEDTTFDPTGNADGKLDPSIKPAPINPRPLGGLTGTAGCVFPPNPALSKVNYRGAFASTAVTLWTTPWTALNIGGVLAD